MCARCAAATSVREAATRVISLSDIAQAEELARTGAMLRTISMREAR